MINNEVEKIRLALLIEYNGKNLVGWQKQNNGKSVQGEIEQVAKILFKIDCPVQGAGRTDAGVNALGQVAHIDIPKLNRFFLPFLDLIFRCFHLYCMFLQLPNPAIP